MNANDSTNGPRFSTVKDLAKEWQVSERTIRRLICSGELVAHDVGCQKRISPEDKERYLRQRRGL